MEMKKWIKYEVINCLTLHVTVMIATKKGIFILTKEGRMSMSNCMKEE
jgi:hypothetical protein